MNELLHKEISTSVALIVIVATVAVIALLA